jgi:hypothetical protein
VLVGHLLDDFAAWRRILRHRQRYNSALIISLFETSANAIASVEPAKWVRGRLLINISGETDVDMNVHE